ncbi:MAG: transcriptional antiterminator, Rof [Gammaproteobacteria bacterium]|nr:transcriptional antiterminator, Rof [Gammaproteobacteria bacterium]
MGSEYESIDCSTYSEYELAIIWRQRLRLRWRDEDDLDHLEIVRPMDLETLRGEEFLIAQTASKERLRVRLDHILQAITLPEEAPENHSERHQ